MEEGGREDEEKKGQERCRDGMDEMNCLSRHGCSLTLCG